jgi:predicted hydrocarbon binding protein
MTDDEKMVTNMSMRAAVDCITEVMGANGARIIFRNAHLEDLYASPPPYDWSPCIPVHMQTQVYIEVANLIGLKGALSIWRRIGYSGMKSANEIGHMFDSFKDLAPDERYNKCTEILAVAIAKGKTVMSGTGRVDFDGFDCTLCSPYYNSEFHLPVCYVYTGVFQYIADWVYGKSAMQVVETRCKAKGDDTCYYELNKAE